MDVLWSPWRYDYIKSGDASSDDKVCVFCSLLNNPASDDDKYIVHRAGYNFVVLNIYPYSTGHLMIVPFAHTGELDELPTDAAAEMIELTKTGQKILREVYAPDGFNVGMNLGEAAGAGVAGHIHMHILPRWAGDANFMTAIGQTRTLPEDLKTTYDKLKNKF